MEMQLKIKIKTRTINLTEEEAILLVHTLRDHCDKGPSPCGWQSDELAALSDKVYNIVVGKLPK